MDFKVARRHASAFLGGIGLLSTFLALLIGFAAETQNIAEHAQAKLAKKGADWIVANDVSGDVMGGETNAIHIVTASGIESWDDLPKDAVAGKLIEKVADALSVRSH